MDYSKFYSNWNALSLTELFDFSLAWILMMSINMSCAFTLASYKLNPHWRVSVPIDQMDSHKPCIDWMFQVRMMKGVGVGIAFKYLKK